MRFLHISDIHIGKRLNGYSLYDDQKHILLQIAYIASEKKADAVIIAGDIYDKSQASAEAVSMFDSFLTLLDRTGLKVYAVSGNHDSGERVGYGSGIFKKIGIYIAGNYEGRITKEVFRDEYGDVNIYMLPFISQYDVRHFAGDNEIKISDCNDAVKYVLDNEEIDFSQRNVIIAHQLVADGVRLPFFSQDEHIVVGGTDAVSYKLFENFDYTALGHIHSRQKVGDNGQVWYSGAPLKYSFSSEDDIKSVSLVTINEKGSVQIEEIELEPLRKMVTVKKPFNEMLEDKITYDFIKAEIQDDVDELDMFLRLKEVYKNLVSITYSNRRLGEIKSVTYEEISKKTDTELFMDFYRKINGVQPDENAVMLIDKLLEEIKGGEQ